MNTCDLSHNNLSDHTHQNILWAEKPVLLFDKVLKTSFRSYLYEMSVYELSIVLIITGPILGLL